MFFTRHLEARSGWNRDIVEIESEKTQYKNYSKNTSSKITHISNLSRMTIFFDILDNRINI